MRPSLFKTAAARSERMVKEAVMGMVWNGLKWIASHPGLAATAAFTVPDALGAAKRGYRATPGGLPKVPSASSLNV